MIERTTVPKTPPIIAVIGALLCGGSIADDVAEEGASVAVVEAAGASVATNSVSMSAEAGASVTVLGAAAGVGVVLLVWLGAAGRAAEGVVSWGVGT